MKNFQLSPKAWHFQRSLMYASLLFLVMVSLFPFWVMIMNATRQHSDILRGGLTLLPADNLWENYKNTSEYVNLWLGLRNSLILSLPSTIVGVYLACLAAYAFSVYDFLGKTFLFIFIISFMMVPPQLSMIGLFDISAQFKIFGKAPLYDSFAIIILPAWANISALFFLRQFIVTTLNPAIIEQGRIEGISEFAIFNRLVLPLMRPGISAIAIFTFIASWNNLFSPLVLLNDPHKMPLPVMLAKIPNQILGDYGMIYFMIAFSVIPVIIVFLLLSKQIVAGLTLGSVKG